MILQTWDSKVAEFASLTAAECDMNRRFPLSATEVDDYPAIPLTNINAGTKIDKWNPNQLTWLMLEYGGTPKAYTKAQVSSS